MQRCRSAAMVVLVVCLAGQWALAEDAPWRVLIADDMEKGIGAWKRSGAADYRQDGEMVRGGKASARMAVTEPRYQQLNRVTKEPVFPGNKYRASIWVRTEGVSRDPGAYLVLEFLEGNRRLEIVHSKTGAKNGSEGWEKLTVEGLAPKGCSVVRIGAVLHAKGTAWFDDATLETDGVPAEKRAVKSEKKAVPAEERAVKTARIRIDSKQVLNPNFLGFGFHVFFPCHVKQLTPEIRNEVLRKRWLELRPSFARITHKWKLGEAHLAELVATMKMMQKTGTSVYLTTWDAKATPPGAEREAYAKATVAMLEELRKQGCDNLRWYCLANELSVRGDIGTGVNLKGWGALRAHMDTFKDYHRLFHQELKKRKLDVGLLAADESPNLGVEKARWARKHMDDMTAVYGGHHYINGHGLDDLGFYNWFLKLSRSASAVAPDKPYIVGEFGAKQHRTSRYGFKKWDGCAYYDTDKEPMVAIQVAEAVLAQLNGGIDATAYWTFSDFPDDYTENKVYVNK